jgi:hypothetical protein
MDEQMIQQHLNVVNTFISFTLSNAIWPDQIVDNVYNYQSALYLRQYALLETHRAAVVAALSQYFHVRTHPQAANREELGNRLDLEAWNLLMQIRR